MHKFETTVPVQKADPTKVRLFIGRRPVGVNGLWAMRFRRIMTPPRIIMTPSAQSTGVGNALTLSLHAVDAANLLTSFRESATMELARTLFSRRYPRPGHVCN